MCDEFSWLMQAGLFVHEQEQQTKVQHAEKSNGDAQSEGKKSVVDKIRARKKEEKARGNELVELQGANVSARGVEVVNWLISCFSKAGATICCARSV
jgi:hypothetical protein